MDIPKNVLLNHMNTVDKIVFELSQEHNKLRICEILGKYFLKIKKVYYNFLLNLLNLFIINNLYYICSINS